MLAQAMEQRSDVELRFSLHPGTFYGEAWVSENADSLPASFIPMLSFERRGRSPPDAINGTPFSPPEPATCPARTCRLSYATMTLLKASDISLRVGPS